MTFKKFKEAFLDDEKTREQWENSPVLQFDEKGKLLFNEHNLDILHSIIPRG